MEQANKVQLVTALTTTGAQSQIRLPPAELKALGALMEKTARRYPNQDLSQALPEYIEDFERLSLKFSLRRVAWAIQILRIDANHRNFFPSPNEVAAEIEAELDWEWKEEQKERERVREAEWRIREIEYLELAEEFELFRKQSPDLDLYDGATKFYELRRGLIRERQKARWEAQNELWKAQREEKKRAADSPSENFIEDTNAETDENHV